MFTRIALALIAVANLAVTLIGGLTTTQYILTTAISVLIFAEGIAYLTKGRK